MLTKIAYACRAGIYHIEQEKKCEDVIKSFCSDDLKIVVLSDGAGSKKYALESANIITKETIMFFKKHSIDSFDSLQYIACVNAVFKEKGYCSETAGGTVLFYVENKGQYLIGHLGDGIAISQEKGVFQAVSMPENGENANQTWFLPSDNAHNHFRYKMGEVCDNQCVILSSDGLSDALYDCCTENVADACYKMSEWFDSLTEQEYCESLESNFNDSLAQISADDISIAVIKHIQ